MNCEHPKEKREIVHMSVVFSYAQYWCNQCGAIGTLPLYGPTDETKIKWDLPKDSK